MKVVKAWPFLTLAAITLVVGLVWHLSGLTRDSGMVGSTLFVVSSVLGAPFIASMRLAANLFGGSPIQPVVGFVLGLAPYLIADLLLRRRRHRLRTSRPGA